MSDYIKRVDAIRCITEHKGMTPIAKLEAETVICRIPAADVRENVHAHWIDSHPLDKNDPRMYCSNCGYEQTPRWRDKFCSVCGAQMDEAEDG